MSSARHLTRGNLSYTPLVSQNQIPIHLYNPNQFDFCLKNAQILKNCPCFKILRGNIIMKKFVSTNVSDTYVAFR